VRERKKRGRSRGNLIRSECGSKRKIGKAMGGEEKKGGNFTLTEREFCFALVTAGKEKVFGAPFFSRVGERTRKGKRVLSPLSFLPRIRRKRNLPEGVISPKEKPFPPFEGKTGIPLTSFSGKRRGDPSIQKRK